MRSVAVTLALGACVAVGLYVLLVAVDSAAVRWELEQCRQGAEEGVCR